MNVTHQNADSNGIVFLFGAVFNILANVNFINFIDLIDYSLKALIGGFVWLLYKLAADYIARRAAKNKGKDAEH